MRRHYVSICFITIFFFVKVVTGLCIGVVSHFEITDNKPSLLYTVSWNEIMKRLLWCGVVACSYCHQLMRFSNLHISNNGGYMFWYFLLFSPFTSFVSFAYSICIEFFYWNMNAQLEVNVRSFLCQMKLASFCAYLKIIQAELRMRVEVTNLNE